MHQPVLLMVDDHKPRLAPKMLIDAIYHNVTCSVSRATQPTCGNQMSLNSTNRSRASFRPSYTPRFEPSATSNRHRCIAALRHPIIKRSIQISFEHCGIWPFSSIKMVDMIQYESSIPSDVDPIDQGIMGLFSAEVARREAEKDNAAKLRNQTASIE